MCGDHLPNSHDLYVFLYTDTMRRNLALITIGALRVNEPKYLSHHRRRRVLTSLLILPTIYIFLVANFISRQKRDSVARVYCFAHVFSTSAS